MTPDSNFDFNQENLVWFPKKVWEKGERYIARVTEAEVINAIQKMSLMMVNNLETRYGMNLEEAKKLLWDTSERVTEESAKRVTVVLKYGNCYYDMLNDSLYTKVYDARPFDKYFPKECYGTVFCHTQKAMLITNMEPFEKYKKEVGIKR